MITLVRHIKFAFKALYIKLFASNLKTFICASTSIYKFELAFGYNVAMLEGCQYT
jgi:hypothetical protein